MPPEFDGKWGTKVCYWKLSVTLGSQTLSANSAMWDTV